MDKYKSLGAVKAFALYQSRNDVLQKDNFHGNCNVVVDNLLYSNIYVAVYYQAAYMDFKVEILWEQDDSQPDYKQIGLHGSYSSNFQCFNFNETTNTLSFKDSNHNISIHPA